MMCRDIMQNQNQTMSCMYSIVADKEIFFPRLAKSKEVKCLMRDASNTAATCTKTRYCT